MRGEKICWDKTLAETGVAAAQLVFDVSLESLRPIEPSSSTPSETWSTSFRFFSLVSEDMVIDFKDWPLGNSKTCGLSGTIACASASFGVLNCPEDLLKL